MPTNNNSIINIDTGLYPLEAVISASYVFLDRAYILLDQPKTGVVKVSFKPKKGGAAKLKDEFMNELLFAVERLNAAKRNKRIREFIVGRALFSSVNYNEANAGLEALSMSDNEKDPLGIGTPWQEK